VARRPSWPVTVGAVGGLLVLAAVAVTAVGDLGVRPAATGVTDQDTAVPDRDAAADPTSTTPAAEPSCSEGTDCFAWAVPVDGGERPTTGVGEDVVAVVDGDDLVARDLDDGALRWRRPLGDTTHTTDTARPAGTTHPADATDLSLAGDLVLHLAGDELVARELRDGAERWRTGRVGLADLADAGAYGDVLLVAGPGGRGSVGDGPAPDRVAGLDPRSGEVRWRQDGSDPALHGDGVVLTDAVGAVRDLRPSGTTRWQRDDLARPDLPVSTWVQGPVVRVDRGDGTAALLHTGTGDDLGISGWITDQDGERALVHDGTRRQLHLVDGSGEVAWSVAEPTVDPDDDVCTATLARDGAITVRTCSGRVIALDPGDGAVRSDEPMVTDATAGGGWFHELGPFRVGHGAPTRAGSGQEPTVGLLVRDAEDREVARFPEDTWPVPRRELDGAWTYDLDGVVLFRHRDWLVALRAP
jgi:outer membrane protein assembly factor BamB